MLPVAVIAPVTHAPKQMMRRILELNRDLAHSLRHMLATADVKRNTRPSPVVDVEGRRNICIGLRRGIHTFLLSEPRQLLPPDARRTILSRNHVIFHLFGLHDT